MKEIIIGILVIALILGAILAIAAFVDNNLCNAKTAQLGMPHQWGFWSGCLIQVETRQWIPLDNYYWKDE